MNRNGALKTLASWAVVLTLLLESTALAAGSLSNSLTGLTGNSTQAGTQAAAAAAGLEFSSTDGLAGDFSSDPTVTFGTSGATFGNLFAGDGGRNYMRTIDSYAFDSFVAEVTVSVDTLGTDQIFFGMGSGIIALWGTPDYAGRPSVFLTPENGNLVSNAIDGIAGDWYGPSPPCPAGDWCKAAAPDLVATSSGTHRLRMTFDKDAKTWVGAVDANYAGGAFVADATTATYNLTQSFDDGGFILNGWPTNPSKIYFGGDDGAVFKDFSVQVAGAGVPGDYNANGAVDAADYAAWRNGGPIQNEAASVGAIDAADYDFWRSRFGATTGSAAGLGAASVPEPATLLICIGLAACHALTRRWRSK